MYLVVHSYSFSPFVHLGLYILKSYHKGLMATSNWFGGVEMQTDGDSAGVPDTDTKRPRTGH